MSCNSSVVIVGLCRNLENIIIDSLSRIENLCSYFKESKVFLFENDSTDNTVDLINEYNSQSNIDLILLSTKLNSVFHKNTKDVNRRKDMAAYRNICLEFIRQNIKTDYIIIIDMDLAGGFEIRGIMNSMGFEEDWDAIGSNSIYYRKNKDGIEERTYYDTWAFREFGDWTDKLKETELILEPGQDLIQVYSAFGGLCIYKYDSIIKYNYDESDCEHVTIHKKMIEDGKKIYINPSQITYYNKLKLVQ